MEYPFDSHLNFFRNFLAKFDDCLPIHPVYHLFYKYNCIHWGPFFIGSAVRGPREDRVSTTKQHVFACHLDPSSRGQTQWRDNTLRLVLQT